MRTDDIKILDACCGSRMMWFDKDNPLVDFIDIRSEEYTVNDSSKKAGTRKVTIKPDIVADFRNMPFADNSYNLVAFDPPHIKRIGDNAWMARKYGKLGENWKEDIRKGFDECMRVLKPGGVLVFKWNEHDIKTADVLSLIPYKPLFGHTTGRQAKTIWITFIKQ